jgi:hypothetical protein
MKNAIATMIPNRLILRIMFAKIAASSILIAALFGIMASKAAGDFPCDLTDQCGPNNYNWIHHTCYMGIKCENIDKQHCDAANQWRYRRGEASGTYTTCSMDCATGSQCLSEPGGG